MTGWVLPAWKLWRVDGDQLRSPWTSHLMDSTLAPDGVITAACPYGHRNSPHEGCSCGIYSIPKPATMLHYMSRTGAAGRRGYALTWGTAEAHIVPIEFAGTMPGYRASRYRARAILTEGGDARALTRFGVPVYRGGLTIDHMREIERRRPLVTTNYDLVSRR